MGNSKFIKTRIESIGSYLPAKVVTTKQVLEDCVNPLKIPMERITGIKERRMAGEVEFALDLSIKAVENCFSHSKYTAKDIDLVICCNISRLNAHDTFSFDPSTAVQIANHFGFDDAIVYDISNACAGFFTGLNLAESYLKSGAAKRVLVVSGEYITHLTKTAQKEIVDMHDNRLACLTLGDSGIALILENSDKEEVGFDEMEILTLGKYSPFCIAKATDQPHGGGIMYTNSKALHDVATVEGAKSVCTMANEYGPEKIDLFICHQTSRISIWNGIRLVNRGMKEGFKKYFNRQNVIDNLTKRGNTSTTTHMLAVMDYIKTDRLHDNQTMMFSINASGLTIGSAIYRFDDLPSRIKNNHDLGTTTPKIDKIIEIPYEIEVPRIMFDVVELTPDSVERDSIKMSNAAGQACIDAAGIQPDEIDLLIYSGVLRDEFVVEPAIAAIIAGDLEVRSEFFKENNNGLAFDVMNGGLGFLNACHAAQHMIQGGKSTQALIVNSEIENNKVLFPDELAGIEETGSAAILKVSDNGSRGFTSFVFTKNTDHVGSRALTNAWRSGGKAVLVKEEDENIESAYLAIAKEAVDKIMVQERLNFSKITKIIPQQISGDFIKKLSETLNQPLDKFVDVTAGKKDLFTNSIPYAMKAAMTNGEVQEGDLVLILSVSSGVQAGAAIYQF